MSERPLLDKQSVRRSFDRAAITYDAAAVLQHEVAERGLERLDLIRHQPACILDAGCGTGNALRGLSQRYRRSRIVALDLAPAMLRQAHSKFNWWQHLLGRSAQSVCGDLESLPLASASMDLIWSNLALQWVNRLPQAFNEMRRVLAPGGLLMLTTLGPDTLKELRAAQHAVDDHSHMSGFVDMHDVGDLLVDAGFADPVVDMEVFTLTYPDVMSLMRDLKAIGAHNAASDRPLGLSGKAWLAATIAAYEAARVNGLLPATYEVIYAHAWAPLPRVGPKGRPIIPIAPMGKQS